MKKIITALLVIHSFAVFSQKGSIQGYVGDLLTQAPLSGVNINLADNGKGDNSDDFGSFHIDNIEPGMYDLVISHIGYKTETFPIEVKGNQSSALSVSLRRSELNLAAVSITGIKYSGLNTLGAIDIKLRPVNNSQDLLRIVPGLLIAQHAGGGKAEQVFLRGYDIDHGTDIHISVDGMPVNVVSHAHGQGYADLHFLIPETVEKIKFDKGPYNTQKGNLATAGYVEFNTMEFLDENSVKIEAGKFNTQRAVVLARLLNKEKQNNRQQFYFASELFNTDGFVKSPQDFHRFNFQGKYTAVFKNHAKLIISASMFDSKWNASGQIPHRAVEAGIISRYGSIDNSEGGNTSRSNFNLKYSKQWKNGWETTNQFYYSRYHFNLYSNFTFFLHDDVNGDAINQNESRSISGYSATVTKNGMLGSRKVSTEFGGGFRFDDVKDIQLSKAANRKWLGNIQKGKIKETNSFLYIHQNLELADKLYLDAGLRYDYFHFGYQDHLAGTLDFNFQNKAVLSPKLRFNYSIIPGLKLFFSNGIGFHSNDTRVILDNKAKNIIPKVYGTDIGFVAKPLKSFVLKTTAWRSYSQQEFVYVGDEGIIEQGGRTVRMGIDVSARYQINSWLFADLDLNYAKARFIDAAKGENYIPLAPSFTSIGGLTAKMKTGFNASLRYRFIDDRPANEFNSVKADGYFITDLILSHAVKVLEFSLSIENVFDREWREAQFETESRLKFEAMPVSEIHYTPGTPMFVKIGVSIKF